MILGAASGLSVDALRPWCASARNVYLGPMYLLTDTPEKYAELTETYGVEMWRTLLRTSEEGVCGIARTRWKALAAFLDEHEPPFQSPVIFADTRDVIFQSDPHAAITDKLLIGTEKKRHDENGWCQMWLQALRPHEAAALASADVLNAGVIGAPALLLRQFALDLSQLLPTIPCGCTAGAWHMTDQTLVNVLLRDGYRSAVEISESWVFHVASLERGRIEATLNPDGQLCLPSGIPFPIVHQYPLAEQLRGYANIR